jgi:hypothetical protein
MATQNFAGRVEMQGNRPEKNDPGYAQTDAAEIMAG